MDEGACKSMDHLKKLRRKDNQTSPKKLLEPISSFRWSVPCLFAVSPTAEPLVPCSKEKINY